MASISRLCVAASRGTDPNEVLTARLHVADNSLSAGSPDAAIRELHKLTQEAEHRNLKYLSLESSVDAAEGMIQRKAYADAQKELESDLGVAEKLGTRYQSARIQFLLARALRLGGKQSDASPHYREALNLFEEMRKEAGAEKLLERPDLKSMASEATEYASPKS